MGAAAKDIFLIPVDHRCLVHAPLHGVTAVVNRAAAGRLRQILTAGHLPADLEEGLGPLARRLCRPPAPAPVHRTGPFAPRRLNLFITGDCNLACRYCVPNGGGAPRATMPEEICTLALASFAAIARRDRLPDVTVYLHGGEPLLHLDRVAFCLAEGRRQAGRLGLPFYLCATTNGCFPEKTAEWAADHFNFLVVSLDGTAGVHDRQRPTANGRGSFATVAAFLHTLRRKNAAFAIRCTVSAQGAAQIADWTRFFCQTFAPRVIAFEPVMPTARSKAAGIGPPEADVFAGGVIEAHRIASQFGIGIELPRCGIDRITRCAQCGLVDDQMIVTPDGSVSTCFAADHENSPHADPFIVGRCHPGRGGLRFDHQRIERVRAMGVESMTACNDCFCRWHCAGGCRIIHSPEAETQVRHLACAITRHLIRWKLLRRVDIATAAVPIQRAEQEQHASI